VCVALLASLTEEMAAQSIAYHAHERTQLLCMEQQTVTNSPVIHGMSAMHCSLRPAPTMINHLTST